MTMGNIFFFFLAMALAATSFTSSTRFQNNLLMPRSSVKTDSSNCLSWRLAVETGNLIKWRVVPEACAKYVADYMLGGQYSDDGDAVFESAFDYAKSLKISGDGKDVWVFDLSETALSNLPYYEQPSVAFGAKPYNRTKFGIWLKAGVAPATPAVIQLYDKLLNLGIKVVFLSGSSELYRESVAKNLENAGYYKYEKLILKPVEKRGTPNVIFKSEERGALEEEGYRIVGCIGDQWGDLIGTHVAERSFKFPNPMYYTS